MIPKDLTNFESELILEVISILQEICSTYLTSDYRELLEATLCLSKPSPYSEARELLKDLLKIENLIRTIRTLYKFRQFQ